MSRETSELWHAVLAIIGIIAFVFVCMSMFQTETIAAVFWLNGLLDGLTWQGFCGAVGTLISAAGICLFLIMLIHVFL